MPFLSSFGGGSIGGFGNHKSTSGPVGVLKNLYAYGFTPGQTGYSANTIGGTFTGPQTVVGSGNKRFHSVQTKADGPFTVTAIMSGGSTGGNGGSTAGETRYFTDISSPSVPAGTEIVFYAGNAGYFNDTSQAGDGTTGGSGGFSFVMYSDPAGGITFNGKQYSMLVLAQAPYAGCDAVYSGGDWPGNDYTLTWSTSTTSIDTWFNAPTSFQAVSYTRGVNTSMGGYPGGKATDDAAPDGGGPGYNYRHPSTASNPAVFSGGYGSYGQITISGFI